MIGEPDHNSTNPEDWKPGGASYIASLQCESMAKDQPAASGPTPSGRQMDLHELTHGKVAFRIMDGFSMLCEDQYEYD